MENEIVNEYLIHNGNTENVRDFDYNDTKKIPGVYEVVRIIQGVPLFIEKHLSRFRSSAKLLGFDLYETDESITMSINKLTTINECKNCNVKIVINNLDNKEQDNYTFIMKSSYPKEEEVKLGVPVILFHAERNNPNAKTTDLNYRKKLSEDILKYNVYEALLVNKNNEITEGSKSNFFMVKGDTIYTPPAENVLPGVTRGFVIDLCTKLNLKIIETPVALNLLAQADGLFITGTSPQVLPISLVDKAEFPSAKNPVIIKIRDAYEALVKDYVSSYKG